VKTLLFAGTVLCGKLVRFAYPRQLHLQREAASLGATLTHAAFATTASHPARLLDFADFRPTALWENAPLFQDPYALSANCAADGAEAAAAVLIHASLALEALPLLTFSEYLAMSIFKCPRRTVLCRLVRIDALTSLGLLSEAHATLSSLLSGTLLPTPRCGRGSVPLPAASAATRFHARCYPGSAENKAAIAEVVQGTMSGELVAWLQPWLCAEIALARCRWLYSVARVPYLWCKTHPTEGREIDASDSVPEKVRIQGVVK
jgi:hypothetical protein